MLTLSLALRSLANRRLATALTAASIALSVALLVGVETVRRGVRESFAGTVRHTDLIVGARGGPQQLLLSSVFGLGSPAGAVSWDTYQRWAAHPAVKWTIPISLGDSYRGYRLVGTTPTFFERYRFRNDGQITVAQGTIIATDHDIDVGSEVASRLHLRLDTAIAITHGLRGEGISEHAQHPFTVVGILAPTYTPVDRSVFITLDGVEAMHVGFEEGGGDEADPDHHDHAGEHSITAFLVGTKNRFESLRLQREMNTDVREPLTAILPAVSLTELWHTIGYAEDGARFITAIVVLVGLLGMIVALYSTLEERRREMAILRSLGAGPRRIAALLVLESGMLSATGAVVGVGLSYALMMIGGSMAEQHFGIAIPITAPGQVEWMYIGGVLVAGLLVGLVPAWRAFRNALQDGLTIRL
jgi:putative ABC transport system permease protein